VDRVDHRGTSHGAGTLQAADYHAQTAVSNILKALDNATKQAVAAGSPTPRHPGC
jgi:hypothetical protein